MLMHTQNSPHRSRSILCASPGRRPQPESINRSLEHSPGAQYLELSRAYEHTSANLSSSMASMLPPNLQAFHPGYYTAPPPIYTSHPSQFSGYYPPVDGGFSSNAYNTFTSSLESYENPTGFGGVLYDPTDPRQPPIPPSTPDEPTSSNPEFHYHPCRWQGGPRCNGLAPGRNREMGEHLRVHHHFIGHERDTVQCEWEGCGQTMQRMNVARHIVSRHLLAAACCRHCGKRFCRPDVVGRHERTCNGIFPAGGYSATRA